MEEAIAALAASAKAAGSADEVILDTNSRAEDLSVDQFVEAFKVLGPPPGVLPRPALANTALDDMIGDSEGDGDDEDDE